MVNVAALISSCLLCVGFFCPAFARGNHRWGVGWVRPPHHEAFGRGSEEGQWDFLPILVNKGHRSTASLLFALGFLMRLGRLLSTTCTEQVPRCAMAPRSLGTVIPNGAVTIFLPAPNAQTKLQKAQQKQNQPTAMLGCEASWKQNHIPKTGDP